MKRRTNAVVVLAALACVAAWALTASAQRPADIPAAGAPAVGENDGPQYSAGTTNLMRPANYREWVFLSAGLDMAYGAPSGMSGASQMHMFTNVFVDPAAYHAFKSAGTWPDKTVLMLEIRHTGTDRRPNRAGLFQVEAVGLEAHVKDASRNGWRFYNFDGAGSGNPLPQDSSCNTCHAEHGAVDNTFVQFYPELLTVAKAKGTIKPGFELEAVQKP
jgi:hypothetical protein